jgi:hypothetical protein
VIRGVFVETGANLDWTEVVARCLAYLCLNSDEGKKHQGVLDKVDFLTRLGVPLSEAASICGSTLASVKELQRLAKKPKAKKSKSAPKKSKK